MSAMYDPALAETGDDPKKTEIVAAIPKRWMHLSKNKRCSSVLRESLNALQRTFEK